MSSLAEVDSSHYYLGVSPPSVEEQSSLFLTLPPFLPRRDKKLTKVHSVHRTPRVIRSTLDTDDTVIKFFDQLDLLHQFDLFLPICSDLLSRFVLLT